MASIVIGADNFVLLGGGTFSIFRILDSIFDLNAGVVVSHYDCGLPSPKKGSSFWIYWFGGHHTVSEVSKDSYN